MIDLLLTGEQPVSGSFDPSYERRRDLLLGMMRRQRWDEPEEKPRSKQGRKPKVVERIPSSESEINVTKRKDRPGFKFV